jgi:hypothetical protein
MPIEMTTQPEATRKAKGNQVDSDGETMTITATHNSKIVEIDGERFCLPLDIDPLAWANDVEEAGEAEGDYELVAWGWKVAATLLAADVAATAK